MKTEALRRLVAVALALVGVVHLLPLSGALGAERLGALYGVAIDEPNLALLMRHRAVLFGVLGAFMVCAALRPAWHGPALLAGAVSVASFLALAALEGGLNAHVGRVVMVDVAALAALAIGGIAHLWAYSSPHAR
jgi:hypothetical protein